MVYETKVGNDKILHKNKFEHFHNAYNEHNVDEASNHMDNK